MVMPDNSWNPPYNKEVIKQTDRTTVLTLGHCMGHVFEKAIDLKYDLADYIDKFMNSAVAMCMDETISDYQWRGSPYIIKSFLEEMEDFGISINSATEEQNNYHEYYKEAAYWAGYVVTLWHYQTAERAIEISAKVKGSELIDSYPFWHTQSVRNFVDSYDGSPLDPKIVARENARLGITPSLYRDK